MESFKINKNIILRNDDSKVLVKDTGDVIQLDAIGLYVLTFLEKNSDVAALIKDLTQFYDISDLTEEQLQTFILEFLTDCENLSIGNFDK